LRGAALYGLGKRDLAEPLLERAWEAGGRGRSLLLYLARLRSATNQPERAAEPYRILLDTSTDSLTAEDYAHLAMIAAYSSGLGDVSYEQRASFCDACVRLAGARFSQLPNARDVLEIRKDAHVRIIQDKKHLVSLADWMEWLAQAGDIKELEKTIAEVRQMRQNQHLSPEQHFTLLEGIESYIEALPDLRPSLADEYQAIATSVVDRSLRDNQPIPAYIQDMQRALHFLDRQVADFIREYIETERQALAARNEPIPEQIIEETSPVDLSEIRVALVGGHESVRREVIYELSKEHGLRDPIEVAPSREAHIDQSSVQTKIANATLIAVITGYMGHDLSGIVRNLQQAGSLSGKVCWLSCRGKSGVVREVLAAVRQDG
jgi:hypothetical protein